MVDIVITDRDGSERKIAADTGLSLMEVIRDNGFEQFLAMCGGSCSCGTCHVYLYAPEGARLAPVSADEDDLLSSSEHRAPLSRLSCQIPITQSLDGTMVIIAPEG
ncbi:ferredoxin [Sphingobium lactosutens]|nr:2Fe-2S iron-sulfur cluster-binding protein [Sphingobium lactosutens]NWK94561.1 ferredoxin [Sphingobium lactosutens]